MKVKFDALVKECKSKALVSLDKEYEVKLQGANLNMALLAHAPADNQVKVTVEWDDKQ